MRHFSRSALLSALTLLCLPFGADGQECRACSVESYDVMPLSIPEAVGGVAGHPLSAVLDGRGRIWVIYQGDLPVYFMPDGSWGGRLGRRGEGPAEFTFPSAVFVAGGDSIAVVDPGNQRLSVWSNELELGRTLAMRNPIARAYTLDWPNRILAGANILTPSRAGWPMHIADLSGSTVDYVESFGAEQGELTRGPVGAMVLDRRFWRAGDHWWIANTLEPIVRRWSIEDRTVLEERATTMPAWFGNPTEALQRGGDLPSRIDGVWYDDESGVVWMFVRDGDDEKFNRALEGLRAGGAREIGGSRVPAESEIYNTRVVALDTSGGIYADVDLEGLVVDVLTDGRVVFAVPGRFGVIQTSVRRFRMEGR